MFLDEHPELLGVGDDVALDEWLYGMSDALISDDTYEHDDRDASHGPTSSVLPRSVGTLQAEITPQELRTIEIRESFRGYHREQVDSLCERAAETIEQVQRQRSVLQERLGGRRDPETGAVRVIDPAASTGIHPLSNIARDADLIRRTLILAQKTADEVVAEADARADALVAGAEIKAHALVHAAEDEACRLEDGERRRIAAEVLELSATRETLLADIDTLQGFAMEYRDRIRHAVEAELERLGESAVFEVEAPSAPEFHEALGPVHEPEVEPGLPISAHSPEAHH
jgi:cell division septum initiation protein DivIVA